MSAPWYDPAPGERLAIQATTGGGGGGGGDGGGGMLPIADPTGVTIETTANTVKGDGTYDVLVVPAETPVLAVKLAGDAFPRVVISADPTDWGAILLGDGTSDPARGAVIGVNGGQLHLSSLGVVVSGDVIFQDTFSGAVLVAPDNSKHRLKVANDGTLSTEPVT